MSFCDFSSFPFSSPPFFVHSFSSFFTPKSFFPVHKSLTLNSPDLLALWRRDSHSKAPCLTHFFPGFPELSFPLLSFDLSSGSKVLLFERSPIFPPGVGLPNFRKDSGVCRFVGHLFCPYPLCYPFESQNRPAFRFRTEPPSSS